VEAAARREVGAPLLYVGVAPFLFEHAKRVAGPATPWIPGLAAGVVHAMTVGRLIARIDVPSLWLDDQWVAPPFPPGCLAMAKR